MQILTAMWIRYIVKHRSIFQLERKSSYNVHEYTRIIFENLCCIEVIGKGDVLAFCNLSGFVFWPGGIFDRDWEKNSIC